MAAAQSFLARIDQSRGPDFAKFPVKFPVSREFNRETGAISTASPARQSGLRADIPRGAEKGRQQRAFAFGLRSRDSHFAFLAGQIAESLRPFSEIFPFSGEYDPETWFDRDCQVRAAVRR